MTGSRTRPAILIAGLLLGLLAVTLQGVQGEELEKVPSEDQCRPYIEKALKDLGTEGSHEHEETSAEDGQSTEKDDEGPGEESAADVNDDDDKSGGREKRDVSLEDQEGDHDDDDNKENETEKSENEADQDQVETVEITSVEAEDESVQVVDTDSKEDGDQTKEADGADESPEEQEQGEGAEDDGDDGDDRDSGEGKSDEDGGTAEEVAGSDEQKEEEEDVASAQDDDDTNEIDEEHDKDDGPTDNVESDEQKEDAAESDDKSGEEEEQAKSAEDEAASVASVEEADAGESKEESEQQQAESLEEEATDEQGEDSKDEEGVDDPKSEEKEAEGADDDDKKSVEEEEVTAETDSGSVGQELDVAEDSEEAKESEGDKSNETEKEEEDESKDEEAEKSEEGGEGEGESEGDGGTDGEEGEDGEEDEDSRPEEEELIMEIEIPEVLRPRDHIGQLLKLDEENEPKEQAIEKVADVVLRDLKRLYDNAIKPLETLYKYRDLSNRHFGDPEIFSKPLVLFMGPWSGGKSSIINYLLDIEYKPTSLRTGAEPSPAYFNILMHGDEEEILDGTQLAADWTFSGLQKFGQGLLDRLKGYKFNNKLLEKVNIVEIPGILEIRKQVQRLFPFNDACQWFIDRADIIFLVYDPSKLDVGPETEAILDQLKGREYQTRIILNKADQVKPEELMRVQGALIWNISPLMSSAEPPIMYSASLWSIPYEAGAPTRLLYAQERAFLRDLRSAIDKRVEHKIASARRFAVRVRNHAKMVDCYLTTYYNHKSFFAKKKETADRIIENPQDYHIYEGLSTLTNISRYDLPDPDVYRDFFRLNTLYEFPLLSSTCTYFRGCPINRLDVAIAYDLPELVGKYKKSVEAVLHQEEEIASAEAAPTPAPVAQQAQKPGARSAASRMSLS